MTRKWVLACSHNKVTIEDYRCALTEMECFTIFEALDLIDFYLERSLAKSCNMGDDLSSYGWKGSSELGKLEKAIKNYIGVSDEQFLIAKTGAFPKTLKRFGYDNNRPICIDCPRVAITIEFTVSEGVIKPRKGSTRIECFLRHIRNAIAHGNTFFFPNNNVLFLDRKDKNVTGFILMPSKALISIKKLSDSQPV